MTTRLQDFLRKIEAPAGMLNTKMDYSRKLPAPVGMVKRTSASNTSRFLTVLEQERQIGQF